MFRSSPSALLAASRSPMALDLAYAFSTVLCMTVLGLAHGFRVILTGTTGASAFSVVPSSSSSTSSSSSPLPFVKAPSISSALSSSPSSSSRCWAGGMSESNTARARSAASGRPDLAQASMDTAYRFLHGKTLSDPSARSASSRSTILSTISAGCNPHSLSLSFSSSSSCFPTARSLAPAVFPPPFPPPPPRRSFRAASAEARAQRRHSGRGSSRWDGRREPGGYDFASRKTEVRE
mmetsp:Transcript_21983/g.65025  ORF Transcript_21983/g.65025 Transcript_21983/m.65025 type:complete len:236 (+) Transcript_21983:165-872(+)